MTHNSRKKHGYANCDETARTQIKPDMKSCASDEQPWLYDKGNKKITKSEQSYKGKVKTHKYINRQNQSTTGKL